MWKVQGVCEVVREREDSGCEDVREMEESTWCEVVRERECGV